MGCNPSGHGTSVRSYALKIVALMRETDSWKTSSFIVGSPAYQIPIPNTTRKKKANETVTEMPQEGWVLTNKIELSPDQAAKFFEFLTAEEETLDLLHKCAIIGTCTTKQSNN